MSASRTVPALLLALAACAPAAHIEAYTPKRRTYEAPTPTVTSPEDSQGSLWRPDARNASLFSDYRAFREHDLVVVRIEENADARRDATTDLKRSSSIQAKVRAFLTSAGLNPDVSLGAEGNTALDFSADGRTGRSERLTATVPAIVRKVLPNGNLFIEGHRVVLVNSEEQHFYISGVVRPIDIAQDNSVRSSHVADAEIEFTGRGVLTNNGQPTPLQRALPYALPF